MLLRTSYPIRCHHHRPSIRVASNEPINEEKIELIESLKSLSLTNIIKNIVKSITSSSTSITKAIKKVTIVEKLKFLTIIEYKITILIITKSPKSKTIPKIAT